MILNRKYFDKETANEIRFVHDEKLTAILIDGAFYRRRAYTAFGDVSAEERANELYSYCKKHLVEKINGVTHIHQLYRIFYYDCPPSDKVVYNPVSKKQICLKKEETYTWANEFFNNLLSKRKVALRLGKLADSQAQFVLSNKALKQLCNGTIKVEDLKEKDVSINIQQKGVDMKIGLDIATLAYNKLVDQIVLISGDSDFVPAAKLARREGIDFILDPLFANVKPELSEHIDGLRTCDNKFKFKDN